MKAFVDMDGVLCDFVGYVEKEYQIKVDAWEFWKNIPGFTEEQFWAGCGYNFWSELPWTSDGKDILQAVESVIGQENVCLLTSPCNTVGCCDGKRKWIETNMPQHRRRFLIGPVKHFCAGPDRVLIDDSDEHITAFIEAGGEGILIPRPWNRMRWATETPFHMETYVREALKSRMGQDLY